MIRVACVPRPPLLPQGVQTRLAHADKQTGDTGVYFGVGARVEGSTDPMRCLAVCQTELVVRMLDESLMPSFEVDFVVESKPLARRLHDAGLHVSSADPRRTDTYLKADITPGTCVIVEDSGKRSLRRILESIRDAGATLVYVLGVGAAATTRRASRGAPRPDCRRRASSRSRRW